MNKTPFFTVGIPMYNTARWVGEALDSILSQDFDDYEIICVDDGSKDNTVEIVQGYAEKDSRIKIVARSNDGPSTARNAIIMHAQGEYVFMLDSDDTMCERVMSQAYEKIIEDNYPDVLQMGLIKHHGLGDSLRITPWLPEKPFSYAEHLEKSKLTKDDYIIKMWYDGKVKAEVASKFINRKFLFDNGLVFQGLYFAREDGDFIFRVLRKAETVSILQAPAYVYYLPREGSISTVSSFRTHKSIIMYYVNFFREIEDWKISEEYKGMLKFKQDEIYMLFRSESLNLPVGRSKEECFKLTGMMDFYFGKQIRRLPFTTGKTVIEKAAFLIYKIFGIKYGFRLLYHPFYYWLKFRKVIK